MPKKCPWERLPEYMQLNGDDPMMMQPVPDLSDYTSKAWEYILINLNDCYVKCKGILLLLLL